MTDISNVVQTASFSKNASARTNNYELAVIYDEEEDEFKITKTRGKFDAEYASDEIMERWNELSRRHREASEEKKALLKGFSRVSVCPLCGSDEVVSVHNKRDWIKSQMNINEFADCTLYGL